MNFDESHLKLIRKQLVGGSSPLSGTINKGLQLIHFYENPVVLLLGAHWVHFLLR